MKVQIRSFITAGLFALFAVSTPALSQDSAWYAGINVGQSKVDLDCAGATNCDDKSNAWSIFGGYQFNKNFGVELGYVDLGKATASGPVLGVPVSVSFEATGFELSGVGTLPLSEKFSLYGKLGVFFWDLDAKVTGGLGAGSLSEDGADLTFAIGVRYNFTKNFTVQAQWQRYNDIGDDATTGKSDVDVIGVGIIFRF